MGLVEVYAWENISEEVLDKTYPLYSGETIEVSPYYNTALILNMDYGDVNGTKNVNKQGGGTRFKGLLEKNVRIIS